MRLPITILVCVAVVGTLEAATVSIDAQTRFQTIEGLGTAIPEWRYGVNDNTSYMNAMVQDLGVSMLRVMNHATNKMAQSASMATIPINQRKSVTALNASVSSISAMNAQ